MKEQVALAKKIYISYFYKYKTHVTMQFAIHAKNLVFHAINFAIETNVNISFLFWTNLFFLLMLNHDGNKYKVIFNDCGST